MRIHLSDLFLGTAIAIVAGASVLFQGNDLEREVAGKWERERGVADWTSVLVGEAIGAPTWPRFSTPSILSEGEDQLWTVVGNLALETETGEIEQQTYRALVRKLCTDIEARKCWRLNELELDGDVLVSAVTREAAIAATGASEGAAAGDAPATVEPSADEPSAEAEETASEPMVPEPSVSETPSAATAVTEASGVDTPGAASSDADRGAGPTPPATLPPMETAPPDRVTAEDLATAEIAADEVAADDVAANEIAADEVPNEEAPPEEVAEDDVAGDEVAPDEVAADEMAADEVAANEVADGETAPSTDAAESLAAEESPAPLATETAAAALPEPADLADDAPPAEVAAYPDLPDEAQVLPAPPADALADAPEPTAAAVDGDPAGPGDSADDSTDGPAETAGQRPATADGAAPAIPEAGTAGDGTAAGDVTLAAVSDAIEREAAALDGGDEGTEATEGAEEPLYTWADPRVLLPIQRSLKSMGFDIGVVDGVLGPRTREAIRQYQADNGLTVDGAATEALQQHMEQAARPETAAEPTEDAPEAAAPEALAEPDTEAAGTAETANASDASGDRAGEDDTAAGAPEEELYTWADPSLLLPIQRYLTTLGFGIGRPDGILGPRTREAIRRYQEDNDLPVDGTATEVLKRHMERRLDIDPDQTAAAAGTSRPPELPALPEAPPAEPSILVQQIQERLSRLGYNIGPADGLLGPKTREAIGTFQWQKGLTVDGLPSYQLLIQMDRELES